jgi:uncharacterized membrane protein YphA (DoxX/SURF4 family)
MHVRMIALAGIRIGLGLVWIVAGVGKLRSHASTRDAARRLTRLPNGLAGAIAAALPPAETVLGLLLLAGWRIRMLAGISAGLFTLFAVLVAAAAIRGALADGGCGCLGTRASSAGQGNPAKAGRIWARNLVLAVLALAVAFRE